MLKLEVKPTEVVRIQRLQKQSQNCQMLIDLKTEKMWIVKRDQGLWKCNYFYRMGYSFFTITNLKSSLKSKSIIGKRCVALKIVGCLSMLIIRRRFGTITVVCVHVQVSDDRGWFCDAENSWLPVDVDNREALWDDTRGLRACSHER